MEQVSYKEQRLTNVWVEAVWLIVPLFLLLVAGELLPGRFYPDAGTLSGIGFWWGFTALTLVAVVDLAVQYAAMRSFGARPWFAYFRFTLSSAPGTPWISEGHRFSRDQFVKILQWPAYASLAILLLCLLTLEKPWWILAAPLLAAATRQLLYAFRMLREPAGTLVEERREGTILHEPAGSYYDLKRAKAE
ncbi:MAG: hypothetical protein ACFB50_17440 [Rubrobacteraceae bacterium]